MYALRVKSIRQQGTHSMETAKKEYRGVRGGEKDGEILSLLELEGIGPAKKLRIEPAQRVNLITGDNGLGKTFILESAWWALSGGWTDSPVYPRDDAEKDEPGISWRMSDAAGGRATETAGYDWKKQAWRAAKERRINPGLLIFARMDGAFAVWDPARSSSPGSNGDVANPLLFTSEDVWDGLRLKIGPKAKYLCNGLINDWINWQNNPENRERPQRKMVILVDEIEAHLHPQWQRVILPALLDVLENLEKNLRIQFFVATHSPLVMASMETRVDPRKDKIIHLKLFQKKPDTGDVVAEAPDFFPYGSANFWFMSDIFEMKHPRSMEVEHAWSTQRPCK